MALASEHTNRKPSAKKNSQAASSMFPHSTQLVQKQAAANALGTGRKPGDRAESRRANVEGVAFLLIAMGTHKGLTGIH